jgi:hypothetical protein
MSEISQLELKEILRYNQDTGLFYWNSPGVGRKNILTRPAGSLRLNGYVGICINQKAYYAHRLAWLYVTGLFPTNQIDHINHNRSDNRFINLREASNSTNGVNQSLSSNNKSGFNGVSWDKRRRKFISYIMKEGKSYYLGAFNAPEEASEAYKEKAKELGFHENHGIKSSYQ